jgi:predicted Zn-dependent protease
MLALGWSDEDVYLVADRAHALYLQGCYRESAILLEGLTAVDPRNIYCHDALTAVYLALEQPAQAITEASAVLRLAPNHHEARARRCEAYLQLRRYDEARQDLEALRRARSMALVKRLQLRMRAAGVPG